MHAPPAAESAQIRESRLPVGATLAGIAIVSIFCFIGLRPTARARFQLWRGNDRAAAEIYEKLLAQNPQRVKLYAPLAEIYLRLGRNDERALKVYKSVVHFNLATSRREEINTMVAQKYLTEGRMDTDAIEVLEGALKAEMRKQNLAISLRR
jgi:predicted Zn-dependent protease